MHVRTRPNIAQALNKVFEEFRKPALSNMEHGLMAILASQGLDL